MNRNDYLSITPEIQQAIADGKPVVSPDVKPQN